MFYNSYIANYKYFNTSSDSILFNETSRIRTVARIFTNPEWNKTIQYNSTPTQIL